MPWLLACYSLTCYQLQLQLCVQMGMIDLQTMVWAFVAAWTPPNPHLSVTKPTMKLCSKRIVVPIIEVLILTVVTQTACFALMNSADWYQGSHTGTHIQVGLTSSL